MNVPKAILMKAFISGRARTKTTLSLWNHFRHMQELMPKPCINLRNKATWISLLLCVPHVEATVAGQMMGNLKGHGWWPGAWSRESWDNNNKQLNKPIENTNFLTSVYKMDTLQSLVHGHCYFIIIMWLPLQNKSWSLDSPLYLNHMILPPAAHPLPSPHTTQSSPVFSSLHFLLHTVFTVPVMCSRTFLKFNFMKIVSCCV